MTTDPTSTAATPTLQSTIAELLRGEIMSGAYEPGTALREIPLAERFGTSRQTVREALRALADLGLVEMKSRRGAVLPMLGPRRVREVYTLRALLEPFALRLSLIEGCIKREQRQRIEAAYARMRECADRGDVASLIEADMAFHWALCAPCGHGMLLEFLQRLQAATRLSMLHMKVYGSDAEGEVESHAPILHSVMNHDADGAAAALREHIISNGERLQLRVLEERSED